MRARAGQVIRTIWFLASFISFFLEEMKTKLSIFIERWREEQLDYNAPNYTLKVLIMYLISE